jgi:hypothetical protein
METYTLDPSKISLDRFYQLTRSRRMLPSRRLLHEKIEERFRIVREAGIGNLKELIKSLGSKSRIESFAAETGIPAEYLVLLKREAGSYLARPFPLADFPGIPYEYTESLKSRRIRNTRDFFDSVQESGAMEPLSRSTGIPVERLKEILALCDLSRITGVGGVFARVVYDAGIRSTREFAKTDAPTHFRKYMEVIDTYGYAAGHFVEEDIQYCIDYAKVICET